MGSDSSKEATGSASEAKAVNNNIAVTESGSQQFGTAVILLWVIVAIKIAELCLSVYQAHRRSLKKKYLPNNP